MAKLLIDGKLVYCESYEVLEEVHPFVVISQFEPDHTQGHCAQVTNARMPVWIVRMPVIPFGNCAAQPMQWRDVYVIFYRGMVLEVRLTFHEDKPQAFRVSIPGENVLHGIMVRRVNDLLSIEKLQDMGFVTSSVHMTKIGQHDRLFYMAGKDRVIIPWNQQSDG
jgi:hypothetical protein